MSSLHNVEFKIRRAQEHLTDLQARIEVWTETETIGLVHDHDTETGWHTLRAERVPEPPEEWIGVLTDYAQNLRTSLEYLIEGLVISNGGTPKASNKFPIISLAIHAAGFGPCVVGVPPAAIPTLQLLQPYSRPNRSKREPLEILANLSNIDKHHRLHGVVVTSLALDDLMSMPPNTRLAAYGAVARDTFQVKEYRMLTRRLPIGEAPLFSVRVEPPAAKMDMKGSLQPIDIDVAFSNGEMTSLKEVSNLIAVVREIVEMLRPHFGASKPSSR